MEYSGQFEGSGRNMSFQSGRTGMPSPPTSFTLPPPPPSPVLLSADAEDFVPMPNLLNQIRNVLYHYNSQNSSTYHKYVPVCEQIMQTENVNKDVRLGRAQASGQTQQHGYTSTANLATTMNTRMTENPRLIIPSTTDSAGKPNKNQLPLVPDSDSTPPWTIAYYE